MIHRKAEEIALSETERVTQQLEEFGVYETYSSFVGIVCLGVNAIINDVVESLVHPTSITSVVTIASRTID